MQDNKDGVSRLVKTAVKVQRKLGGGGNLLMDAPSHQTFAELVQLASSRQIWKARSERKFGRAKREALTRKHKVSKVKYTISQQQARDDVGRWVGTGADAVWVGLTPAPTIFVPPMTSPEVPVLSHSNLTTPSQPPTATAIQQTVGKVQSKLPQSWCVPAKN